MYLLLLFTLIFATPIQVSRWGNRVIKTGSDIAFRPAYSAIREETNRRLEVALEKPMAFISGVSKFQGPPSSCLHVFDSMI